MAKFTRNLAIYAVLRYSLIGIATISTFVQVGVFARVLDEKTLAFLMVLYGYAVFLNWIDAGLSRPVYPALREQFLKKGNYEDLLVNTIGVYLILSFAAVLIFTFAGQLLSVILDHNLTLTTVSLISATIGMNTGISFFRNLYAAIDGYIQYELIDLARRVSNLLIFGLAAIDDTLMLMATVHVCTTAVLLVVTVTLLTLQGNSRLGEVVRNAPRSFAPMYRRFGSDIKSYFVFMINETVVYNVGFILFPLFLSSSAIVVFGLWMRIVGGFGTLVRAVCDVLIHKFTDEHFKGNHSASYRTQIAMLVASGLLALVLVSVFWWLKDVILYYWVANKYEITGLQIFALTIWVFGNGLQHVSGTVLLAMGGFFDTVRTISTKVAVSVVALAVVSVFSGCELTTILLLLSITYITGAMLYLNAGLAATRDFALQAMASR